MPQSQASWEEQQMTSHGHHEAITKVKQQESESSWSGPFWCAGQRWQVRVDCKDKSLGLYLCAHPIDSGDIRSLQFALTLINRVDSDKSIRQGTSKGITYTCNQGKSWGWKSIARVEDVSREQFALDGYFHVKVEFLGHPRISASTTKQQEELACTTQGKNEAAKPSSQVVLEGLHANFIARCPKTAVHANTFLAESAHCTWKVLGDASQAFAISVQSKGDVAEFMLHVDDVSLLQQLPLFADIIRSTTSFNTSKEGNQKDSDQSKSLAGNDKEEPSSKREVPFNPPCSFWGLVCVTLLVKGTYTPRELFGDRTTPPSLPSSTLQMARFLGMKGLQDIMADWLKMVLQHYLQNAQSSNGTKDLGQHVDQEMWQYYSDVLQLLPADFAGSFVVAALKAEDAQQILPSILLMPSAVVRGWLHSLTSLDLHGASGKDTCMLLSFLQCDNNLQVLHLDISGTKEQPISMPGDKVTGKRTRSTASEPDTVLQCDNSSWNVLMTLESTAHRLSSKLRVLGLHNIPRLSPQHYMQLSGVFACWSGSLTGVTFTYKKRGMLDSTEKKLLFTAISRLMKLKVLAVPQWKQLVGSDTEAALPLRRMPCLQHVSVDGDITGPSFDIPGLKFKTQEACSKVDA